MVCTSIFEDDITGAVLCDILGSARLGTGPGELEFHKAMRCCRGDSASLDPTRGCL